MYVVIPTIAKNIIQNETLDTKKFKNSLKPKVLSVTRTTDTSGKSDMLLTLEFYTHIDTIDYFETKQAETQRSKNFSNLPVSIDLMLSKNNLDFYRGKSKKTVVDAVKKNMNLRNVKSSLKQGVKLGQKNKVKDLTPNQTLRSIGLTQEFEIDKKQNLYKDAFKIGSFSIDNIPEKVTRQKLFIRQFDGASSSGLMPVSEPFNNTVFKNTYLNMIETGFDPAYFFDESFQKNSHKRKLSGLKNKTSVKSENQKRAVQNLIAEVEKKVLLASDNTRIRFQDVEERAIKISTVVNINYNKLSDFGERINVILISKNAFGLNLQSKDYVMLLSDIDKQIEKHSAEYSLVTSRTSSGVSVLSVNNKDKKSKVSLNVKAKKVNPSIPYEFCYYEDLSVVNVKPGENSSLRDGTFLSRKKVPTRFKKSETIYYRTLLNFNGKSYHNAKSIVDQSQDRHRLVPYVTIVCTISESDKLFNVRVQNFSKNIVSVRPRKYVFKGDSSATGELQYLTSFTGEKITDFTSVNGRNTLIFQDKDVHRTTRYKYVVECVMKNGQTKMASNCFFEEFEERTHTMKITNITRTNTQNGNNLGSGITSSDVKRKQDVKRGIALSFVVQKNKNEIDKILENMFGNLFELFKSDLQSIRDVQSFVTSVKVERIDLLTGDFTTLGTVTPDESGRCTFLDNNAPVYSDVIYKFTPRMLPSQDIITFVNQQIEFFAEKTIFQTSQYIRASSQRKLQNRTNRFGKIISRKNSHVPTRRSFLKGISSTPKVAFNQNNFDFFMESSTGDIEYFESSGINLMLGNKNLSVASPKIPTEIELVDKGNNTAKQRASIKTRSVTKTSKKSGISRLSNKIRDVKNIRDSAYEVDFEIQGDDTYVDFYCMFIKENETVYLDGIMHSTEEPKPSKKYRYLAFHNGSFGIVEYYIVAVFKDGTISEPKLVSAQEITE